MLTACLLFSLWTSIGSAGRSGNLVEAHTLQTADAVAEWSMASILLLGFTLLLFG
jgi:hypothetical protein